MPFELRYNTADQEIPLGYFLDSSDGDTEETGLTIANTDIKIWKWGATTLADKNSGGGTHISNGIYYAVFDATDTNTLGPAKVFVHMSGAIALEVEISIVSQQYWDAKYGSGNFSSNVSSISNDVITPASIDEDADFVIQALSITNALDAGSVLVDGTTTLTGNVSCGAGFDVVGALSANTLLIDSTTTLTGAVSCGSTFDVVGELSANSVLVDVGTVLTGAVTTGAVTAASVSVTGQLDAGNLLVDGTTVLTGTVGTGAATLASLTSTGEVTVGDGIVVTCSTDSKAAIKATGGATAGNGMELIGTGTGIDLKADITGNVTGNVSGTVAGKTPAEVGDLGTVQSGDSYAIVNGDHGLVSIQDDIDAILTDTGTTLENRLIAIEADTNELQADWANAGRLDAIIDELTSQGDTNEGKLDTIAGYIDTEIGTIITAVGTTLVNHLLDIKGTGFAKDTHSLPQCLTATGFSTHDAAAVKTAIEAAGSHLTLIKAVTDVLTAAAATKLALSAGTIVAGTVSHDNTAASTTVFYSDDITEATADHFNGRIIIFTSGALQYQATDITDYALDTGEGKFTVTALTEAPPDNCTFIIV